jgi:tRNA 2-thiouridine synthesizing protein E
MPENTGDQRRIVKVINGVEIIVDSDGFMQNPLLWSEDVARFLAQEAGIAVLNDLQWQVLRFIRTYYLEQGKTPMNQKIKQGTGLSLMKIEALFPGGIANGARRLAGLPKGRGCAAG